MKKVRSLVRRAGTITREGNYTRWAVCSLIIAVGMAVTFYFWKASQTQLSSDINAKYQRQVGIMQSLLNLRLQQYSNVLNGGAGLFTVYDHVTQTDWGTYYKAYDLPHNYPGIDAVSFSRYVPNQDVPNYLEMLATEGRSNITIWPAGERAAYAPITYIAALSPVSYKSFGFDPLSDAIRGAAMREARDTGTPVMTHKISLVAAHKGQAAFIIYKPIYSHSADTVSARQSAIYGYVFAATNVNNLLDNILAQIQTANYAFQIFDGTSLSKGSLMYQTSNFSKLEKQAVKVGTFPLTFDNRTWSIQLAVAPNVIPLSEREQPLLNVLRGITATTIVAGSTWYFITSRERRFARLRQHEIQSVKDDILSLASHQLRTPATIVKQHIGILLHNYAGKITTQQRKLLEAAYASNEHQLEIINQFLDAARLEPGHAELRRERTNLNALLEKIINEQEKVFKSQEQKFSYKIPGRPVHLMADKQYLSVVFENLLGNASKYTPPRGKIILKMQKLQNEVQIIVTDTGIGLTDSERAIVFDKFTRIHNDFTADSNGTGIGLYLAKQIVILHGGTIAVESTPGHGSSFIVHLPITQ